MKQLYFAVLILLFGFYGQGQVTMVTNMPPVVAPTSDLKIEVKINKGSIGNFSKYEMDLPQGFEATEGNSKTGYFTFEKNKVKIVWVTIPAETEFIVSFKLRAPLATGPYILYHKFLYMDNGVKKEVNGQQIDLKVDPTGVTKTFSYLPDEPETPPSVTNTVAVINTPTVPVSIANNVIQSNTVATVVPTKTAATVNTPAVVAAGNTITTTSSNTLSVPQPGLTFLVQIGTFGTDPGKAKYADLGKVTVEKDGALYKVLIGEYNTKEEALKKREELVTKGYNGFLVKYQNGQRVK